MALWAGRFSKEIDAGVIEAAKSMGASTWQIIFKVLLPESKPSLLVGAAISITTILGYSAMAGCVGAGGLGDIIVRGTNATNGGAIILAGALPTALMAIISDLALGFLERRLEPKGKSAS